MRTDRPRSAALRLFSVNNANGRYRKVASRRAGRGGGGDRALARRAGWLFGNRLIGRSPPRRRSIASRATTSDDRRVGLGRGAAADAARGRIYLPAEDLGRFHVPAEDLRDGRRTEEFVRLMEFEAARARGYYKESAPLIEMVEPRSRPSLWALIQIYSRLLDRIERTNYDVLGRRVELSAREKLEIIAKAAVGTR